MRNLSDATGITVETMAALSAESERLGMEWGDLEGAIEAVSERLVQAGERHRRDVRRYEHARGGHQRDHENVSRSGSSRLSAWRWQG